MGLMNNKKGVFFTFTAILLVTLLFLSYSSILNGVSAKNHYSEINRIESMNSFLLNLEQESSNAVYTSSFRGLIAILESITSSGTFISSSNDALIELITHGTLDSTPSYLMENNTLIHWISKMNTQAQKIGINLTLEFIEINISHSDPWTIQVNTSIRTFLKDIRDVAYWNTTFTSSAKISIIEFDDPVFIVNTGNKLSRRVRESPFYRTFSSVLDVENHSIEGYYIPFTSAPSYLMRLEGNLGPNLYGIESLVNKDELQKHLLIDETKTNVDYLYFSTNNPVSFDISGIPNFFSMDNLTGINLTHLEEYNLTSHIN